MAISVLWPPYSLVHIHSSLFRQPTKLFLWIPNMQSLNPKFTNLKQPSKPIKIATARDKINKVGEDGWEIWRQNSENIAYIQLQLLWFIYYLIDNHIAKYQFIIWLFNLILNDFLWLLGRFEKGCLCLRGWVVSNELGFGWFEIKFRGNIVPTFNLQLWILFLFHFLLIQQSLPKQQQAKIN